MNCRAQRADFAESDAGPMMGLRLVMLSVIPTSVFYQYYR